MRPLVLFLCLVPLLTGCGATLVTPAVVEPHVQTTTGGPIHGNVYGGHRTIAGTHVHLLATGTTGYGSAAASLLTTNISGTDSIGGYITADGNGSFSIAGSYACAPGQELYLLGTGGNSQPDPDAPSNAAIGLMAALGVCPADGNVDSLSVTLNEVSTIAMAYALAPFAADATHIGAPDTPAAFVSIQNAFANVANLVDPLTGVPLATTPAGNGVAPQAAVSTLANILASCVDTNGSVPPTCPSLFSYSTADGTLYGSRPTETATAAINIAHHPAANIAALFGLVNAASPFAGGFSTAPADLTLTLKFETNTPAPAALAVDAAGDVWFPFSNGLGVLTPGGAPMRNSPFHDGSLSDPRAIAIDGNDNVWLANYSGGSYSHFNLYTEAFDSAQVSGLNYPTSIALDPAGDVWFTNYLDNSLTKLSSSGSLLGTFANASLWNPMQTLSDPAGNLWTPNPNDSSIVEVSNSGHSPTPSVFTNGIVDPALGSQIAALDAAHNLWILNQDSSIAAISSTTGEAIAGTPFNTGANAVPTALAVDSGTNIWTLSTTQDPNDPDALPVSQLSGFTRNGNTLLSGHAFDTNMTSLAVDNSGNLWIGSNNAGTISEVLGIASPVVTPIAVGVAHNTLATRP